MHEYPHAVVSESLPATGAPLPPDWALQVPGDHIAVLKIVVPQGIADAGVNPDKVTGIGTDFTACTMVRPAEVTPLCELRKFAGRPHAFVKLLRHDAAQSKPTGSTRWPRPR